MITKTGMEIPLRDDFETRNTQKFLPGMNNLVKTELSRWRRTWTWWIQILIMLAFINGILALTQLGAGAGEVEVDTSPESPVMLFSVFLGIWPVFSIITMIQGILVEEKHSGTAAWILSKPVSRKAFIVAKFATNAISTTISMILIPAVVGFFQLKYAYRVVIDTGGFVTAIFVIWLFLMFWLTLVLMLGAFFKTRKQVIGISLIVLVLLSMFSGMIPQEFNIAFFQPDSSGASLFTELVNGNGLLSPFPIIILTVFVISFLIMAIWRFQREDL